MTGPELEQYLAASRAETLEELQRWLPQDRRHTGGLYELMLDYPLRPAKALRPALAIATCRALGGSLDRVLPTAAVLELYHNAFLVHDDVEDGSELRRQAPTLHRLHGVPVAVNVGDGMLALSLEPLLANTRIVGLGQALRILACFGRMARESAEGQMLELAWIRDHRWDLGDRDYVRMVWKKTAWYSFITPLSVGAITAGAGPDTIRVLGRLGTFLGVAFQITDDLLNLVGDQAALGKERDGDLWEGKHTLILGHALRRSSAAARREAIAILAKNRPRDAAAPGPGERTRADVATLRDLIERTGALPHAAQVAQRWAGGAGRILETRLGHLPPSNHLEFLRALVDYVAARSW